MATILIVDDNQDILDLLSHFFDSKGHRVLTATDAEDGLKKVRDEKACPDLDGYHDAPHPRRRSTPSGEGDRPGD